MDINNKIKNNKWWLILIALLIAIGIGGKIQMDQREKDLKELHQIQKDIANYIYQHFVITTNDEKKDAEIDKQYERNKDKWTIIEYLDKLKAAQLRYDIEKIEFTNMKVNPMNSLEIQFTINDVYNDYITLDTISVETNTWDYNIGQYGGAGPYYLENKKQVTREPFPDHKIIYYEGGIN